MGTTITSSLTESDVAAIRATTEPWCRACVDQDWDTLLAFCTDDIAFLPPNAPGVSGEAVRPYLDSFPPIKAFAEEFEELEGSGDVAWATGPVTMTLDVSGEEVAIVGKFMDAFRKGEDGKWRYARIVWNTDSPM